MKHKLLGPGSLLLVGLLFGISGVIAKHLSEVMSAYQIVGHRFGIALLGALAVAALSGGVRLGGVKRWRLAAYAISFPVSVVLFTLSVVYGTVAAAVFSFYAATLLSSFALGRWWFGETITRTRAVALLLVLVGLAVMSIPELDGSGGSGLLYGILAGLMQGVASSLQKRLSGLEHRASLLVVQCLAGIAAALLVVAIAGQSVTVPLGAADWIITAVFGVLLLAIAYLFLVGFRYTDLHTGSLLVSSELVFGPLLAWMLLGEQVVASTWIGGALVAAGGVLAYGLKEKPRSDSPT